MENKNGCPARHVNARSRRLAQWQCPANHVYNSKVCTRTKKLDPQGCPCPDCYDGPRVDLRQVDLAFRKFVCTKANRGFNLKYLPVSFKVFWLCETNPGHIWYESFNQLLERDFECRKCHAENISELMGSLANFPNLVEEIHPIENESLDPSKISRGSHLVVTWKCPQGPDHVWKAPVYNRTLKESGCPCCANRQVSVTNCLAKVMPSVAGDLHPSLNGSNTIDNIIATSTKSYWWHCQYCHHGWQATARARAVGKAPCPNCKAKPVAPIVVSAVEQLEDIVNKAGQSASVTSKKPVPMDVQQSRGISAGDVRTCGQKQKQPAQPANTISKNRKQLNTKQPIGISAGDLRTYGQNRIEADQRAGDPPRTKGSLTHDSLPYGAIVAGDMLTCFKNRRNDDLARAP
jgi:hypothetical protein